MTIAEKKSSVYFKTVLSQCAKCSGKFDFLWPLGGGVCDACLVSNFTLEEALQKTCGCHHDKIRQLFLKI